MNTNQFISICLAVWFCLMALAVAYPKAPAQWNWQVADDDDAAFLRSAKARGGPIAAPVWFLKTHDGKRGSPVAAPLWFLQTGGKRDAEAVNEDAGLWMVGDKAVKGKLENLYFHF